MVHEQQNMKTITWAIGSNKDLDQLFNKLREQQYNRQDHRLWNNYSTDFLQYVIACTICYDDRDNPVMCSTISSRDCWPNRAFRILNRLWKPDQRIKFPRVMSASFGYSAISQIDWLKNNTDCELYFISRQTPNWEKFVILEFKRQFKIEWSSTTNKYLTCPNECDDSCWQTILYQGNSQLLELWKHRP